MREPTIVLRNMSREEEQRIVDHLNEQRRTLFEK
jgi:hypothetical protein